MTTGGSLNSANDAIQDQAFERGNNKDPVIPSKIVQLIQLL